MSDQQPRWLSLEQAANLLKVGVPTVQTMINRGILVAELHEGQAVLGYDAILAFLRGDQHKLMDAAGQLPDLGLLPSDQD